MTLSLLLSIGTIPTILTGVSSARCIQPKDKPTAPRPEAREVAPPPRVYAPGIPAASGTVVKVTKDSITLQDYWGLKGRALNWLQTEDRKATISFGSFTLHSEEGTFVALKTIRTKDKLTLVSAEGKEKVVKLKDQPHRRFWAGEALASGEYLRTWRRLPISDKYTYRLSDVRVGDQVSVYIHRQDGYEICEAIGIERRPGGRVPPAPGEKPGTTAPYHERMNAYQDLEEKGTPLPARFRTGIPEREVPHIPDARP